MNTENLVFKDGCLNFEDVDYAYQHTRITFDEVDLAFEVNHEEDIEIVHILNCARLSCDEVTVFIGGCANPALVTETQVQVGDGKNYLVATFKCLANNNQAVS